MLERQRQEELLKTKKDQATETKDRIDFLESNRSSIVNWIDWLKARRAELAKEIALLKDELTIEEQKLRDLPDTVTDLKKTLSAQVSDTVKLHKSIKQIPGSAEDDQRTIDEIEQIRRRAISAVDDLLK
ncbi:unnamed protein product [Urochloa humidicola]